MKLTKYGLLLGSIALLASCSDDKVVDNVNNPQASTGDVYGKFTISLPSTIGTKAIGAGDFEDGENDEFAVTNAFLYIFEAADGEEDTAQMVERVSLTLEDDEEDYVDITQTKDYTVKLSNVSIPTYGSSLKYYGLVILNEPDALNKTYGPAEKSTITTWKSKVLSIAVNNDNEDEEDPLSLMKTGEYYTMTNAPQFELNENQTKTFKYLVELDPTKFGKEPAQAIAPAGIFYVQRGVAKIQVSGNTEWKYTPKDNTNGDQVTFSNWTLDVTNTKTYPIQNVDEVDNSSSCPAYFFTAENSGDKIAFNHIWWGKDPNYSSFTEGDFITNKPVEKGLTEVDYCLENLMDHQHMIQNQTTRVIFKATYELGNNEGDDKSFIVFEGNGAACNINKNFLSESVKPGNNVLSSLIASSQSAYLTEIATKLNCNKDATVKYYPDGETYYIARIYHFDPTVEGNETPLVEGQLKPGQSNFLEVKEGKVNYNANQLGRFGVLRNNWYDVKVNSVSGFGSPTVPPPGEDPDDPTNPEDKYNVEVTVNILAWAKRQYDYDLQ